jgi:outer membrane protein insertion porin family
MIRMLKMKWLTVLVPLMLASCGVKKFIPEGEKLYTGANLQLDSAVPKDDKEELQTELEPLIRPQPNSSFLGIRFNLWAFYKGQKDRPGFINRFLAKRFGEEPVYLSDVNPERTMTILVNRLENNGYFYAKDSFFVDESAKFAHIDYTLKFGEPYRLEKYQLVEDTTVVMKAILSSLEETVLEKGHRFNLDDFKAERVRLNLLLKEIGYYNFNPDLLIFEADTNQYEDRRFDLYLRLKSNTPERAIHPYVIEGIDMFPNYSIRGRRNMSDTVNIQGIRIIQGNEEVFKPDLLQQYVLFRPGNIYNPEVSRLTSNRLSSIGNFRYVNIQFTEKDTVRNEDGLYPLQAEILLSPLNKRALRAELQAVTKSNNFVGPALILNYRNRNLFQGGEIFSLTGKIGYEQQLAAGNRQGLRSIELGLQGDLVFPRVLFPIPVMNRFQFAIPKTKISLGFEYQNRTDLYLLNSYNTSFGYLWNVNRYVYHEFNPISVSVVNLARTTPAFDEILDSNPFLRRSFEQQFIFGMNYTFNYNQLVDEERKNAFFVGTTFDISGNMLKGINTLFNSRNPERIFGLEYAQYVRGEVDLRFYHKFTQEVMLVNRVFVGTGVPLGNSLSLPFVKQFFSGGPRSVRSFRIRSLGPGRYISDQFGIGGFFDQAGDIRLEGNMEFRFPFNRYVKGAFFADAGNVWLFNENEALPGGKISSAWAEELGVGVGFGVRVDVQFFVLRLDLATPVRKPWLEPRERWLREFDVRSGDWRRENLILNFAIGYPF